MANRASFPGSETSAALDTVRAADALIETTIAMHREGLPLMRRIIAADEAIRLWDHYPTLDVVCPATGARFFYHVHPPDARDADEHGHFHLFLPRTAMADPSAPLIAPLDREAAPGDAVHVAALSIDTAGLPAALFTVNRWVTDEWLFPAAAVIAAVNTFDLARAPGDHLVNAWLTAMVQLCRPIIAALLDARDERLHASDLAGEDRAIEVLSHVPMDLQALLDAARKENPGRA